jgi:hypothetical protein
MLTLRRAFRDMSQTDAVSSQIYVASNLILPRWTLVQIALKGVSMAVSVISAHLSRRGDLLMSGRIDTLLSTYAFPLPLFLEERLLLIGSEEQAREMLCHLRLSLRERGIGRMQPKVTAVELPRAGRYRVWVDWNEIGAPPGGPGPSQAIYYCRETEDGSRIEMVNYTRLGGRRNRQVEVLALTA